MSEDGTITTSRHNVEFITKILYINLFALQSRLGFRIPHWWKTARNSTLWSLQQKVWREAHLLELIIPPPISLVAGNKLHTTTTTPYTTLAWAQQGQFVRKLHFLLVTHMTFSPSGRGKSQTTGWPRESSSYPRVVSEGIFVTTVQYACWVYSTSYSRGLLFCAYRGPWIRHYTSSTDRIPIGILLHGPRKPYRGSRKPSGSTICPLSQF